MDNIAFAPQPKTYPEGRGDTMGGVWGTLPTTLQEGGLLCLLSKTPSPLGLYVYVYIISYYKYKDNTLEKQIMGHKKRDNFFRTFLKSDDYIIPLESIPTQSMNSEGIWHVKILYSHKRRTSHSFILPTPLGGEEMGRVSNTNKSNNYYIILVIIN